MPFASEKLKKKSNDSGSAVYYLVVAKGKKRPAWTSNDTTRHATNDDSQRWQLIGQNGYNVDASRSR